MKLTKPLILLCKASGLFLSTEQSTPDNEALKNLRRMFAKGTDLMNIVLWINEDYKYVYGCEPM